MSFDNNSQSQKAQGYLNYSDRYEQRSETEWDMIEELERDENLGRDIFKCFVVDASDFTDSSAGAAAGSYIRALLLPADWKDGRPVPCGKDVKSAQMRDFIKSECIEAISETKLGDSRTFAISPGDRVWAYWVNQNRKTEGLIFKLDKIEKDIDGNYNFDCLKITRQKVDLKYTNSNSPRPKVTPGAPWRIPDTPKCLRYRDGLRAKDVRIDKSFAHLGGTVSQIPNCINCFRGGKLMNDADIQALKDKGIQTVIRFNWEKGGGFDLATEKAKVEAAGMTYWGHQLHKGKPPTPTAWAQIKNYLLQGNVYIHCKAGVDRTGGVVARWILETESALRGMTSITKEFKQEVLDYTISYPSQHWKYAERDPKKREKYDTTKNRPANGRIKLMDACENRKIKEWAFDINVGLRGNRIFGNTAMVPDQNAANIIKQNGCN